MSDKLAEKPKAHAEEERTRIKREEDEVTIASDERYARASWRASSS